MTTEFAFTGLRLTREHIAKLNYIAASKHVSRNAVILWALDAYLGHFSLPDCLQEKSNDHEEGHIEHQEPK